jgi:hypothetical protein
MLIPDPALGFFFSIPDPSSKKGVKNIKLVVLPICIHKYRYNNIANYLIFINRYRKRPVSTDKENKYFNPQNC